MKDIPVPMREIVEFLTSAKTPLAIAGGFAAILFLVISQILSNKDKNWKINNQLLILIINRLFVLAIVAMALGFLGFILPVKSGPISQSTQTVLQNKNISFNILNRRNRVGLQNITVNIMNLPARRFISNPNGLVSLDFISTNDEDSLLLEFKSAEFGIQNLKEISIVNHPKILYFDVRKKIEIVGNTKTSIPRIERREPTTLHDNDAEFALRIKSMLYKIKFGSSINDVYTFELGNSFSGNIEYETLPVATECTDKKIRYYWKYIDESKIGVEVHDFLRSIGLDSLITKDSYLIYFFVENKLVRINLRLIPSDNNFDKAFSSALTKGTSLKPINYNKVGA